MEVHIIKIVSDKCHSVIDKCIEIRNTHGKIIKHGVVITKQDLGKDRITVKMMDQVTGLMKQFGVKHARYQKESMRFYGEVDLTTAVFTINNIPLNTKDVPLI